MRSQQIALNPVGKKLQGALALFPGKHALALRCQTLRDPLRQSITPDRLDLQRHPQAVERAKPGAALARLVQARQQDQGKRVIGAT